MGWCSYLKHPLLSIFEGGTFITDLVDFSLLKLWTNRRSCCFKKRKQNEKSPYFCMLIGPGCFRKYSSTDKGGVKSLLLKNISVVAVLSIIFTLKLPQWLDNLIRCRLISNQLYLCPPHIGLTWNDNNVTCFGSNCMGFPCFQTFFGLVLASMKSDLFRNQINFAKH